MTYGRRNFQDSIALLSSTLKMSYLKYLSAVGISLKNPFENDCKRRSSLAIRLPWNIEQTFHTCCIFITWRAIR